METRQILEDLLKLQAFESNDVLSDDAEKQIAKLRDRIPAPILGHYERLTARGKKGVAIVRNQVCTACHMRVPRASIIYLMHAEDVQLCESCGAYLYLPESTEVELACPVEKSAVKSRKQRELAHVV